MPALKPARCWSLCILFAVLICGCGGKKNPPGRYDLSGTVTYDGQPVPIGVVSFAPDTKNGNQGPGSTGDIVDGQYKTRPGKGVVGGPYVVTISGYPKHADVDLFTPYTVSIDLPAEGGAYDFEVPVQKPKGAARK